MAQDDYYYEIQLTNKQLVFYFMAGAAGLILSFLAGVMVGRGVEGGTTSASETRPVAEERVVAEPSPAITAATPAPSDYSYPQRLETDRPGRGSRAFRARRDGHAAATPHPPSRSRPARGHPGSGPAAAEPTPAPAAATPTPPAADTSPPAATRPRPPATGPLPEGTRVLGRRASRSRWARSRTGRAPTASCGA